MEELEQLKTERNKLQDNLNQLATSLNRKKVPRFAVVILSKIHCIFTLYLGVLDERLKTN